MLAVGMGRRPRQSRKGPGQRRSPSEERPIDSDARLDQADLRRLTTNTTSRIRQIAAIGELPVALQPLDSFVTIVVTPAELLPEIGSSVLERTLTPFGSPVFTSSFGILSIIKMLVTFLVSPGFIMPSAQGNWEEQSPELDWKTMPPLAVLLNETPVARHGPLFVTPA